MWPVSSRTAPNRRNASSSASSSSSCGRERPPWALLSTRHYTPGPIAPQPAERLQSPESHRYTIQILRLTPRSSIAGQRLGPGGSRPRLLAAAVLCSVAAVVSRRDRFHVLGI